MELKEYFKILKQQKQQIILITLIITFLAFLGPLLTPQQYEINFSLYITKETKKTSSEYEYDQHYALKAKEEIGKFIEEYLKNPTVSSEILNKANLNSKSHSLLFRRHFFQVHSLSSQEVQVNYKLKKPDRAEKIATETQKKLKKILKELFSENDNTIYQLKRSSVAISKAGFSPKVNSLLGATAGIFLGVFIALFRHYLRD